MALDGVADLPFLGVHPRVVDFEDLAGRAGGGAHDAEQRDIGGLPVHIAARLLGHHNLATTQAYLAVFQDDLVRSYRAFIDQRRALRPTAKYREPTDEEWTEFQDHFQLRKLELGTCGRPYGTPCAHEHACFSELGHFSAGHASRQARMQPPMSSAAAA